MRLLTQLLLQLQVFVKACGGDLSLVPGAVGILISAISDVDVLLAMRTLDVIATI